MIFVPGGGFVASPRMAAGVIRRHLAQAGYVVAIIEYRTTRSGSTYVEGVADVKSAVRFLRENAERFGIDPRRIVLWGESAGGYLASMAGVTRGDPVRAVVNKFGGSDLTLIADGFDDATVAANTGPGTSFARYVLGPDLGGRARRPAGRGARGRSRQPTPLPTSRRSSTSTARMIGSSRPVQTAPPARRPARGWSRHAPGIWSRARATATWPSRAARRSSGRPSRCSRSRPTSSRERSHPNPLVDAGSGPAARLMRSG